MIRQKTKREQKMQKIIIVGTNGRGKQTRISTRQTSQELEVYFQGENGEIRSEKFTFKITSGGSLALTNENGMLLTQTEGNPASKLSPNR